MPRLSVPDHLEQCQTHLEALHDRHQVALGPFFLLPQLRATDLLIEQIPIEHRV